MGSFQHHIAVQRGQGPLLQQIDDSLASRLLARILRVIDPVTDRDAAPAI
jgi:hypothetical protein